MSSSTATPSVSGTLKKVGSASSSKPSPASTYGGSVASDVGDGIPQTPVDVTASILGKLKKLTVEVKDKKVPVGIYSPPFVRNGARVAIEDPFTSPPARGSGQRTPTSPKKSKSVISGNWRSGSSAGSGSGSASPSSGRGSGHHGRVYSPLISDSGARSSTYPNPIVQSEDAQAIYPPSSCVFVANLLQSESDEALEVAVTRVFREFGTVFVKIRRDLKHMPFAFCQYTNDLAAENAIRLGRGRMISGRPCRCEKAKAHRLFYFERKYGASISTEEAVQILRSYGKIEFCKYPSPVERTTYNLNEGVVVSFQLYDEGQAALQAFRNHEEFKIQSMANLTSSRGTLARQSDPANRVYLETYELDRRSIFVGNLPVDADEAEIENLFKAYGQVVRVTIHQSESIIDASQKHCFAFVEFRNFHVANRILDEMNYVDLRGKTLKVSQKDTEGAKSRNVARRQTIRPLVSTPARNVNYPPPSPARVIVPEQSPTGYPSPAYNAYNSSPYYNGQQWGMYQGQVYPMAHSADYSTYCAALQAHHIAYGTPHPAYSGSPSYNPGTPMTANAGSPTQSHFGYYPGYHASPYYNSGYYPPIAYGHPVPINHVPEEVSSATPTPVGEVVTDDTPSE